MIEGKTVRHANIMLIILMAFMLGCNASDSDKNIPASASLKNVPLSGEALYEKHCKLCHGVKGDLQLNGAKDLNLSVLTLEERQLLISEGKNAMTPFKRILSEDEIKRVAEFSLTFRQNK